MSFNDLERGLGERAPLARDGPFSQGAPHYPTLTSSTEPDAGDVGRTDPERDRRFKMLANKVSTHIFRINSNVSGIQKLVDLLGSSRDTIDIRGKLCVLVD